MVAVVITVRARERLVVIVIAAEAARQAKHGEKRDGNHSQYGSVLFHNHIRSLIVNISF